MDHFTEEHVEAYAMGRLPEAQIAPFEEHLLICPACQQSLQAHDDYLRAMRAALRQPEEVPAISAAGWFSGWRVLSLAGALAMIVLIFLTVSRESAPRIPAAVTLSSFRGAETVKMATAPAGAPLQLGIDSVAAGADCRIEIVNATGDPAWNGALEATAKGFQARVDKGLTAGQYWVRLYGPDAQLLQEFGLTLN